MASCITSTQLPMPGGNARHWNNNWEGIIRTPDAGNGNQHLALVLVLWELHHLVLGVSHGLFLSSATRATRRQGPYSSPLLCRKRSLGPPSKHITSAQPGHTHDRATRRAAYFVHCMPTRVRYDGGWLAGAYVTCPLTRYLVYRRVPFPSSTSALWSRTELG